MWLLFALVQSLPEAKEKRLGLIPLSEEISKQPRIDSIVWLLVVTVMNIYNEEKQENIKFEEKKNGVKGNGVKSSFKEIKKWETEQTE